MQRTSRGQNGGSPLILVFDGLLGDSHVSMCSTNEPREPDGGLKQQASHAMAGPYMYWPERYRPIVRHVLLLSMLRAEACVNMVAHFVKQHWAKQERSDQTDPQHPCGWARDNVVHEQLDPG